MKRLMTIMLVLALAFSMFTVTGMAATAYEYRRYVFTDMYGGTFTFSAADYGYGLDYHTPSDENYINPLIIVADESSISYRAGIGADSENSTYYVGRITKNLSGMRGIAVVTDYAEEIMSGNGTDVIEEFFEGYDEDYAHEDKVVFLHGEGGYLVGIMTETAAKEHADMIDDNGPSLNNQTEVVAFGESYHTEEGLAYDYTIKNNTESRMKGYYALVTYHQKSHTDIHGNKCMGVQINPVELELKAGELTTGSLVSEYGELSNSAHLWVKFKNQTERDEFLALESLTLTENALGRYYTVTGNAEEAFLKDNFGITIE